MSLKHIITFIALLFLAATSTAADFSVIRKYVYPIVVTNNNKQTITSSGSAVVVQEGYILTVAHVAPQKDQTLYVSAAGMKSARLVKIDTANDLALFAADVKCPCAPISNAARVEIDAIAYAVGFPLFLDYRLQILTTGHIQGVRKNDLITTTVTAPGGSGGAIFIKEQNAYRLVGIVKGVAVVDIGPQLMQIGQLQGWFVISTRSTAIRAFLRDSGVVAK